MLHETGWRLGKVLGWCQFNERQRSPLLTAGKMRSSSPLRNAGTLLSSHQNAKYDRVLSGGNRRTNGQRRGVIFRWGHLAGND